MYSVRITDYILTRYGFDRGPFSRVPDAPRSVPITNASTITLSAGKPAGQINPSQTYYHQAGIIRPAHFSLDQASATIIILEQQGP